jgi:hypothetical protein
MSQSQLENNFLSFCFNLLPENANVLRLLLWYMVFGFGFVFGLDLALKPPNPCASP